MIFEATGGRTLPPRRWDPDLAVWSWDDDREAPGVDLEAALGLPGWDDPTEPPATFVVDDGEFFADRADELAVRRWVRSLGSAADLEREAA